MGILNQLTNVLEQYAGSRGQQAPPKVHEDFDQISQTAPRESLGEGLSHAFRSESTPPFGQMVSQLFRNSNPQQRTGLLSTLLSAAGPAGLSALGSRGGGLASLVSAFQSGGINPSHAEQVSPEAVEELAHHAQNQNPSVVDQVSHFYAQHPTLIKTLGAGALALIMAKMAKR